MYAIVHPRSLRDFLMFRDTNPPNVISRHPTLDLAKAARVVSGDIVCYASTLNPVADDFWLWDWEKADPDSYAKSFVRVARG